MSIIKPASLTCKYKTCCEERLNESEYCIFHDPSPDKSATFFETELDIRKKIKKEEVDFEGYVFPREFNQKYFANRGFPENISFCAAIFYCHIIFDRSVFWSNVTFFKTRFIEGACFHGAHFNGEALFEGWPQNTPEDMYEYFYKETDFTLVKIEDEGCIIFRRVDLSKVRFVYTDLSIICFEDVKWAEKYPRRKGLFEDNNRFLKAKIVGIDFKDMAPEWVFSFRGQEDVRNPVVSTKGLSVKEKLNYRQFLPKDVDVTYEYPSNRPAVEVLYRQLKHNFEHRSDYETAGDFHIGEMEMKRISRSWYQSERLLLSAYKHLSFYGERWLRPLAIFFIGLISFSNIFIRTGVMEEGQTTYADMSEMPHAFFYGLQLATLQRPTDFIILTNWTRLLNSIWLVSGPTLIALTLLAIKRRFKR